MIVLWLCVLRVLQKLTRTYKMNRRIPISLAQRQGGLGRHSDEHPTSTDSVLTSTRYGC
jgi:hypothetical protein